jgi:hypothetical protein
MASFSDAMIISARSGDYVMRTPLFSGTWKERFGINLEGCLQETLLLMIVHALTMSIL